MRHALRDFASLINVTNKAARGMGGAAGVKKAQSICA
jgi:hypothetical protein